MASDAERQVRLAGGLGGTVLVVDDSVHVRTVLSRRLSAAGCRTEAAADGLAALEAARALRPDVIVSDWMMPGLDGAALCAAVRAEPALAGCFFIMLTAKETRDDRLGALEAGADDFLVKPWDDLELLARIRSGLRIRRMQREIEETGKRDTLAKLAAALGHEINNSLTSLIGELQLARLAQGLPEEVSEAIDRALEEGRRIADVVARLRSLRVEDTTPYLPGVPMFDLSRKAA